MYVLRMYVCTKNPQQNIMYLNVRNLVHVCRGTNSTPHVPIISREEIKTLNKYKHYDTREERFLHFINELDLLLFSHKCGASK